MIHGLRFWSLFWFGALALAFLASKLTAAIARWKHRRRLARERREFRRAMEQGFSQIGTRNGRPRP